MKLVVCLPGKDFTFSFLRSWTGTVRFFGKQNWQVSMLNHYSADIYNCRNRILFKDLDKMSKNGNPDPLPFDGGTYDYLLWLDSDIGWKPEDIKTLINHNVDVVNGLVPLDLFGQYQVGWYLKRDKSLVEKDLIEEKYQGLIEVDYMGMGYALIKKGVFEKVGYPWFSPKKRVMPSGIGIQVSEDVSFSQKLNEKGIKIHADTNIKATHQKYWELG